MLNKLNNYAYPQVTLSGPVAHNQLLNGNGTGEGAKGISPHNYGYGDPNASLVFSNLGFTASRSFFLNDTELLIRLAARGLICGS